MAKQYEKLKEAQKNLVDKQILQDIQENAIGVLHNRVSGDSNEVSVMVDVAYDSASYRAREIEIRNDLLEQKKKDPNNPLNKNWTPAPIPLVDEERVKALHNYIETRREQLASPQSIAQLEARGVSSLQERIEFLSYPHELLLLGADGNPNLVISPALSEKEVRAMVAEEFKNSTKKLNQLEHVNELRDGTNPNAALPKRSRPGVEHD